MSYAELFKNSHPRAVDIPEAEYLLVKAQVDIAAAAAGYRLAGVRLQKGCLHNENAARRFA